MHGKLLWRKRTAQTMKVTNKEASLPLGNRTIIMPEVTTFCKGAYKKSFFVQNISNV